MELMAGWGGGARLLSARDVSGPSFIQVSHERESEVRVGSGTTVPAADLDECNLRRLKLNRQASIILMFESRWPEDDFKQI